MLIQFRPLIGEWPRKMTFNRTSSQFKAHYNATLDLLDRELEHAGASGVAVQLAVAEQDIAANGNLKGGRLTRHPGVILSYTCKGRQISFPCDKYSDWRENLRAIALSLEALRKVNRYGVSTGEEQYTGWARLEGPAGSTAAPPKLSKAEALAILSTAAGWPVIEFNGEVPANLVEAAFREAAKKTHPDAGGNADDFKRVHEARQVLLG